LTPGHGVAALILLVLVYQAWGRIFTAGGTGSNVVLGLLVAIAVVYVGATNLGPLVDDVLSPKGKQARRALREALELDRDVALLLKRARQGKEKKLHKSRIDDIATAHGALHETIIAFERHAAPKVSLEEKAGALTAALHKALGAQTTSAAFMAQARSLGLAFAVAVALRLFLVAPFQIPSGSMIPTLLIGDHLFVFRAMYGLMSPFGEQPSYLVRWAIPQPGDVIVFEAPPWVQRNAGEDWIKRVIARPGQRVKRIEQTVYVDDKPYTQLGDGKLMRYMDFEELGGGRGRWHEAQAMYHQEAIPGAPHDTFVDIPPVTADWPTPGEPAPSQRGLACTETECTVKEGFVFVMGDNRDHSADGRRWGAVPIDSVKGKALFIWVSVDGSRESVHLGDFTLPDFRWHRIGGWIN
jgi:signal peptidase I